MTSKLSMTSSAGDEASGMTSVAPPRTSSDSNVEVTLTDEAQQALETQELQSWSTRMQRTEVYSRRYRPTTEEREELIELEQFLGLASKKSSSGVGAALGGIPKLFGGLTQSGNPAKSRSQSSASFDSDDQRKDDPTDPNGPSRQAWKRLVHPDEAAKEPASILLKRGPVLWSVLTTDTMDSAPDERESELILLTHGLVVATVVSDANGGGNKTSKRPSRKVILRRFQKAILWSQIMGVEEGDDETSFSVHVQMSRHTEKWNICCATTKQQEAWMDALETVSVQTAIHSKSNHQTTGTQVTYENQADSNVDTSELGWQYRLVQKPIWTMAVTGKPGKGDDQITGSPALNRLDAHNHYAPIHYAVRNGHVQVVHRLLDAGADPNLPDGDKRTPMFYAVHDELPRAMIQTLEAYGAQKSQMVRDEQKGELFGRVQATQRKVDGRREAEAKAAEEQRKAAEAKAQMADNLRLMQQRGEQIDELGDKASELNQNAKNYSDMAKQLKEQSKKQSTWFGF